MGVVNVFGVLLPGFLIGNKEVIPSGGVSPYTGSGYSTRRVVLLSECVPDPGTSPQSWMPRGQEDPLAFFFGGGRGLTGILHQARGKRSVNCFGKLLGSWCDMRVNESPPTSRA